MRLPRDLRFKNSGADKLGLKQSTAADLTRKLYQIDQGRPWRPVSRKNEQTTVVDTGKAAVDDHVSVQLRSFAIFGPKIS
jgi:hypothetical protein